MEKIYLQIGVGFWTILFIQKPEAFFYLSHDPSRGHMYKRIHVSALIILFRTIIQRGDCFSPKSFFNCFQKFSTRFLQKVCHLLNSKLRGTHWQLTPWKFLVCRDTYHIQACHHFSWEKFLKKVTLQLCDVQSLQCYGHAHENCIDWLPSKVGICKAQARDLCFQTSIVWY